MLATDGSVVIITQERAHIPSEIATMRDIEDLLRAIVDHFTLHLRLKQESDRLFWIRPHR